jgi:excisionase family DNA binding protein
MERIMMMLTVKETAHVIGISVTTLYALVKEKSIPHKRIRGRIFFHSDELDKWLRGGCDGVKEKSVLAY